MAAQAREGIRVSGSDRPQELAGLLFLLFEVQDCLLHMPGPQVRRKRVNRRVCLQGAGGRGPFRGQDASCTRLTVSLAKANSSKTAPSVGAALTPRALGYDACHILRGW